MEAEALKLVQENTALYVDEDLTNKLRAASSVSHLGESLLVFLRTPRTQTPNDVASASATTVAAGCTAEDGWIYAGNDVQMFSNVPTAAACCDLCSGNERCRFWTWSREDSHKDMCWIKATREYRINHDGFVSGYRKGET